MFSKILIANRGEIAVRIIRACKELNIKTVAVYSEADADSLHTKLADEALCIGSGPSQSSYLNIPALISAAEITDVEAIHPGYGFLAENAHFAEICESCNIKFIGPPPETIRLMGDKIQAKQFMQKIGIPVVPGSDATIKTKEEVIKVAKKIKYPVIIKASMGGGGKGMRIAHNDIRLISAFMMAQQEAEKAFGVPDVYIERYVEKPRHIEVQIMADKYGKVIHLGERDCSIQRRHQKLLEESPSPFLNEKLRRKITEKAVKGAKACGYVSVGTIEFLVDENHEFYFMEMNTRLQVEHPVTEMLTGIDIVKEQIKIASGERITINQDDVEIRGHAIECRINAEDPENDFIPCPGMIESCIVPGGPGVRLDTHIYSGYKIPPFYDSLLAKLICRGDSRADAISTMKRALGEFHIAPIKTTISLHEMILENKDFIKGRYFTNFLEEMMAEKKEKTNEPA